jgi:serine/threonine-protein kinase RsbW
MDDEGQGSMVTNAQISEPKPERIEIFIPSALGFEKVARRAAAAIAEEIGFSEDRIEDLKTAVAEACLNAIEHGNQQNRWATVTVLLTGQRAHGTYGGGRIEVRVADEGLVPMPDRFPEPGRIGDDGLMRGLGLFFITELMDEVEVMRLPQGGNQVKMVIYLTPENDGLNDHGDD